MSLLPIMLTLFFMFAEQMSNIYVSEWTNTVKKKRKEKGFDCRQLVTDQLTFWIQR